MAFYKVKVVNDFLLSPEQLVKKEETVKITISLTKESLDFFKESAKKITHNIKK